MSAVYVHLSGRDEDDAVLKANGIINNERSSLVDTKESSAICDMMDLDSLVENKLKQIMMKFLA